MQFTRGVLRGLVGLIAAGQAASATPTAVDIFGSAFDPDAVTIDSGGSVEWTNLDGIEHSVDFDDFGSGVLFEGDSFLHVFDDPGGFDYICGIHPWMTGTVTAVAVSGAPTAAATATPASALRARGHSARQATSRGARASYVQPRADEAADYGGGARRSARRAD
jgi:plastocyanin